MLNLDCHGALGDRHPYPYRAGRVHRYFLGPEDLPVEYTAEMQQIEESYRAGTPDEWKWPPGRLDHWGISAKASERMGAAGLKIRFTDDGYRLDEWR